MQTVVETPIFIRRAQKLLTEAEHIDLIVYLAAHPTFMIVRFRCTPYISTERASERT
ncbi:MAG: hypothetical protein ACREUC_20355 [Steroidobacteraceae bacterium]